MAKINIVHLCLQAPYNDYWGYQDNLIPKYNREAGHEVTVITTNTLHDDSGRIAETETGEYCLNDGQRIIRLKYVDFKPRVVAACLRYYKIYPILKRLHPDFIMVHGLGSVSALQVVKYLKKVNPKCVVIADNHMDYYNSSLSSDSWKMHLLRGFWKMFNRNVQKYYKAVYGTTPWRVTYSKDVFGISPDKSALLVTGGDDDKIHFDRAAEIRHDIRAGLGIGDDAFVLVTGGKIDRAKNIHLLMQAVAELNNDNIKLIVFGQPKDDMKEIVEKYSKDKNIFCIGWIEADKAYDYFLASDLSVFPGTHSVLWEQACACGIPGLFKDWEGMRHVDLGGNAEFLYEDSVDEIKEKISEIYNDKEKYARMKKVAEEKGIKTFSYREISKRAIELI